MKKRILLTASRFFPYAYGGGEVYVAAVASELQKNGWDVHIATLGERQEKQKPLKHKYRHLTENHSELKW